MCPLRLLCFPFHQHFLSCFITPSIFPGSAQADLVPFAAAVLTAGLWIRSFPCGFLFTTSIFPWVGTGRPCALRSRGFNRRVMDSIFPLWFSFHDHHFPGSAQADLVPFATAVSTAAHHYYPQMLITWMIRFDSFFFNSIHWLPKFFVSFAPFMFFHFIIAFHRVFFLSPPSFPGRRRPTLCSSQTRFQPPGYGFDLSLVFFFLPPPFFPGWRRPTLCSSQPRFQSPLNRQPPNALHQPPTANCSPPTTNLSLLTSPPR
jgi:hypothetical protein